MSYNETHLNMTADAEIPIHRLVKVTATGVDLVGAGEGHLARAINEEIAVAQGGTGAFRLLNTGGTRKMEAAGPIAHLAVVYAASNGRVDDAVSGAPIGIALAAASGAGEIIEVMPIAGMGLQAAGGGLLRIAAGVVTLDGGNPTPVVTGLSTIVAASACFAGTSAPGLDPHLVTVVLNATPGTLDLYAWKPTGAGDTTMVASTNNTREVHWIAIGT